MSLRLPAHVQSLSAAPSVARKISATMWVRLPWCKRLPLTFPRKHPRGKKPHGLGIGNPPGPKPEELMGVDGAGLRRDGHGSCPPPPHPPSSSSSPIPPRGSRRVLPGLGSTPSLASIPGPRRSILPRKIGLFAWGATARALRPPACWLALASGPTEGGHCRSASGCTAEEHWAFGFAASSCSLFPTEAPAGRAKLSACDHPLLVTV